VVALIHDVVEPLVQALPSAETLPPDATAAFDNLLSASGVASQVAVMRLWRPNGELVYTSDQVGGGTRTPSETDLEQAALEQKLGVKLFQIHAPLYKTGTREIVAVAQLFGVADSLHAELGWARAQAWLVLGGLALAVMAALFKIMQNAGVQIEQQQRVIGEQKDEAARLVSRNEALCKLIDIIHRRGMEHNERLLRRIGSDLHDGPAQHLALVMLRLDELAPDKRVESAPGTSGDALQTIRRATSDALREIRHISAGLALPELQKISLTDALVIAVRAHQRATGTRVETAFGSLPARLPLPFTICLYRFAQEALNNAFRHAGGNGQRLSANYDGATISVEVADSGPGFVVDRPATGGERLGLSGLRYRVESLGGSLQINSVIGQGARLTVQFRNPLA
jgi:signal transduction histidine kinase